MVTLAIFNADRSLTKVAGVAPEKWANPKSAMQARPSWAMRTLLFHDVSATFLAEKNTYTYTLKVPVNNV